VLVVPNTAFASALRSGCQTSSTFNTASITPSGIARNATLLVPGCELLGELLSYVKRDRHGPITPLVRRMSRQTPS
jgi:hypothetical protein